MESVPPNFKNDLIKNRALLCNIISQPKNKKQVLLHSSDASINLMLTIVYLVYNRVIPSTDSYFSQLKNSPRFTYLKRVFKKGSLENLIDNNRKKKVQTILFVWTLLPAIFKLLKKS